MININKYKGKLVEELSLLSDEIIDIEGEFDSDSEMSESAAYFSGFCENKGNELANIKALVQMKSTETELVFTYSILLKNLEHSSEADISKLLAKNWYLNKVYLWPMEINDEWFLLGSLKKTFESYMPGQIKNNLLSIMDEVSNLDF